MFSVYLKYPGMPDENQQKEISAPREKGKDGIGSSGSGCWRGCRMCVLSTSLPVPLISQAVLKDKKKVGNHTPTDGSSLSYSLYRGKQLRFFCCCCYSHIHGELPTPNLFLRSPVQQMSLNNKPWADWKFPFSTFVFHSSKSFYPFFFSLFNDRAV